MYASVNRVSIGSYHSLLQTINHCWVIVNWNPGNKLRWNFNQNAKLFIRENEPQNIVCEMAAILSVGGGGGGLVNPDSKVHGSNIGPSWVLSAPDGHHVGPMYLVIREGFGESIHTCLLSARRIFTQHQHLASSQLLRHDGNDLVPWILYSSGCCHLSLGTHDRYP